ncbi:RNA polymerase sigma factor (sigma-70 family) [Streptomyces ambofaciens]|jgi:RNA polymerase sigma-70 factor (ECF subfamily)|uniref:sigma-70 family RNA polymerase sigma factor n=1 Tax=unclassified Streptomyces TaxID=2593676 RepID=UPI000F4CA8E6
MTMAVPEDSNTPYTLPTPTKELNALQGIHYEMPSDLDAFYRMYARPQLRYAATVLGDMKAAQQVVRRLYSHLALNWSVVLLQDGGPEAYAWRVLKMRVEMHLRMNVGPSADGRSTTPAGTARTTAVHDAVRATLEHMRTQLAAIESPLGLYTAIATLPERQFDVIILQYVLGYPCKQAADIMGITAATARTHRRLARKRIATKLGIDLGDDEEKE